MSTEITQVFNEVWLVGFLTSSSATRLFHRRVPRLTSDNFTCCHTETKRGDHDFCLRQSYYDYTDTDTTSRKLARESNSRPPDQESNAPPTKLHRPPLKERTLRSFIIVAIGTISFPGAFMQHA